MRLLKRVRKSALAQLVPPPRLQLSAWLESTVVLAGGDNATPGPLRLYEYQRAIADAICDPEIERVTLVKGVRIGFSPRSSQVQ